MLKRTERSFNISSVLSNVKPEPDFTPAPTKKYRLHNTDQNNNVGKFICVFTMFYPFVCVCFC